MTEFSKLKPVLAAVSVAAAMTFMSASAVAHSKHSISAEAVKLNATLDQNQGGVVEGIRNRPDWADRINVSGLINVDTTWQNRTPVVTNVSNAPSGFESFYKTPRLDYFGEGEEANDIALADANVFVDARVNDWVNAHVALQFRQDNGLPALRRFFKDSHFDPKDLKQLDSDSEEGNADDLFDELRHDRLRVDEAYFTIGDLERNPIYLRAGHFYVPFGDYQRYPMTDSLPKLLSMTSQTALQLGFVSDAGVSGAVYVFRGLPTDDTTHSYSDGRVRVRNWGAQVAYATDMGDQSYKVGFGYLHNMADVDYISAGLFSAGFGLYAGKYHKDVGAISLYGDGRWGAFDAGVRYVGALEEFSLYDMPFKDDGASPWAFSIDGGYTFALDNYHTRLGVTYQKSGDAKNLGPLWQGLPKQRYGLDYQINLLSHTDLAFELIRDRDYAVANGGTGRKVTIGTVRLSVAFA
jgi:hypothetical protein